MDDLLLPAVYDGAGGTVKHVGSTSIKHKFRMPASVRVKSTVGRWSRSVKHLKNGAQKSIWFAFQTLKKPNSEMVQTHTLKVLTASIGNALSIEKSEELHNKTEQPELDFSSYFSLIETVMFEPLEKISHEETMSLSDIDYQEVHKVCWMLFYNHEKGQSISDDIKENMAFKLWMIFNLFTEEDSSDCPLFPLVLDPEEATIILSAILTQTGNTSLISAATEAFGEEPMPFETFIANFQLQIKKHVKERVLQSAVDNVYEDFVYDVLKRGMVSKRGHQVKSWKERWMILTPTDLKYYVSQQQKHLKGTIIFDKAQTVEILPDKGGKHNLFVLNTPQKPYEMHVMDMKTRNEWVTAIQIAIENSENPHYHHYKELSKQRRQKRNLFRKEKGEAEQKRREEEEENRRLGDAYKQREMMNEEMLQQKLKELEEEREARALLEELLREQKEQREIERQRLLELEASKLELEKLLEAERQAKRDEETVRRLQAKLLEEESEKREELERLKAEQEHLLQQERDKRVGLEDKWEEKDKILAAAKEKLSKLESERAEASDKLQQATERLQLAEKEREKMEEKVKLWKKPNVGLARPIQPKVNPMVTHRGRGAFCAMDFIKKSRQQDKERGLTEEQLDEKYGKISSDEELDENVSTSKDKSPKKDKSMSNSEKDDAKPQTFGEEKAEHSKEDVNNESNIGDEIQMKSGEEKPEKDLIDFEDNIDIIKPQKAPRRKKKNSNTNSDTSSFDNSGENCSEQDGSRNNNAVIENVSDSETESKSKATSAPCAYENVEYTVVYGDNEKSKHKNESVNNGRSPNNSSGLIDSNAEGSEEQMCVPNDEVEYSYAEPEELSAIQSPKQTYVYDYVDVDKKDDHFEIRYT